MEDAVWKRHREDEEKITKRLKTDGNWWSYCKGFFVSILVQFALPLTQPFM